MKNDTNLINLIITQIRDTVDNKEIDDTMLESICTKLKDHANIDIPLLKSTLKNIVSTLSQKTGQMLLEYIHYNKQLISLVVKKNITTNKDQLLQYIYDLKFEAERQKDEDSVYDINMILNAINNDNCNNLESSLLESTKEFKQDNSFEYLMQFTNLEQVKQKNDDFSNFKRKSLSVKTVQELITNNRHVSFSNNNKDLMISSDIKDKITNELDKINEIEFNIFYLNELLGTKASVIVSVEILSCLPYVSNKTISHDTLKRFINKVVNSYDREKVKYHNDLHATDVMQNVYSIIKKGNLFMKMKLENLDVFAILLAAICHNLKHTGQSNSFHINTRSHIAIKYNDKSVLENYHLAQTFKILNNDTFNILKNFSTEEYRIIRRRMIDSILANDMTQHQKVLGEILSQIEKYQINNGNNFELIYEQEDTAKLFKDQQNCLNFILHVSDIIYPAKPEDISSKWAAMIFEEFFEQGDLEKKLNLTPSHLCDRSSTNIPEAQIDFINYICKPALEILVTIVPETQTYISYLNRNYEKLIKEKK